MRSRNAWEHIRTNKKGTNLRKSSADATEQKNGDTKKQRLQILNLFTLLFSICLY